MILGLNAYHGDSSVVALGSAGPAGLEEERLRRAKHWAGFRAQALSLLAGGDGPIEAAAVGRKPGAHLFSKALHALKGGTGLSAILERVRNAGRVKGIEARIREVVPAARLAKDFGVIPVEHHRAHLASAFLCSPLERAALCSVDGFGDFLSTAPATTRNWTTCTVTGCAPRATRRRRPRGRRRPRADLVGPASRPRHVRIASPGSPAELGRGSRAQAGDASRPALASMCDGVSYGR